MKNMGFADRALFILGLTLAGVVSFVLVAGVIIAMLNLYVSSSLPRKRAKDRKVLLKDVREEETEN